MSKTWKCKIKWGWQWSKLYLEHMDNLEEAGKERREMFVQEKRTEDYPNDRATEIGSNIKKSSEKLERFAVIQISEKTTSRAAVKNQVLRGLVYCHSHQRYQLEIHHNVYSFLNVWVKLIRNIL